MNLQSISVNGQKLPIDSSVFTTSSNAGTIIDSGTTLAYLSEEAYTPFVNAVSNGYLDTKLIYVNDFQLLNLSYYNESGVEVFIRVIGLISG